MQVLLLRFLCSLLCRCRCMKAGTGGLVTSWQSSFQLNCSAGSFHIVALQELQQQLVAQKQTMAGVQQEHLQHCKEMQSTLASQLREPAQQNEAATAAADRAASFEAQLEDAGRATSSLQGQLEAAGSAASSLQSQLVAVQLQLATEQKRHQDAQHAVANLELQLQVTLVYGAWSKATS